jgi:hypothetical protein
VGDGHLAVATGMQLGACGVEECTIPCGMDPMMRAFSLLDHSSVPLIGYDSGVDIAGVEEDKFHSGT